MTSRFFRLPLPLIRTLDMTSWSPLRLVIGSLCLIFLSTHSGNAQLDRGGIVGIVTDESQAAVPGAIVVIRNTETGQEANLTTDTGGRYAASLLRAGTYVVTAEQFGFSKTVQSNVVLDVGQVANVNFVPLT